VVRHRHGADGGLRHHVVHVGQGRAWGGGSGAAGPNGQWGEIERGVGGACGLAGSGGRVAAKWGRGEKIK
jgi:hypothetical protein